MLKFAWSKASAGVFAKMRRAGRPAHRGFQLSSRVRWALALAVVLTNACTRAAEVDRNAQAAPMDDLTVSRDIAFAPGDRQKLDVYVLSKPGPPRPVVVYLHGGAWVWGSKEDHAWVGAGLARHGFVAVVPNYRLHPEGVWPLFLQDNAAAVRWAKDNAAKFGGDPSAIVLMGHSSGAFNAFSLAVDHRWLNAVGLDPAKDLKALVGLAGPYRMLPPDRGAETDIFGPGRNYTEPADHIDGKSPPMLLVVGKDDRVAGPANTPEMAELVRKKGGVAEGFLYPNVSHSDVQDAAGGVPGQSSEFVWGEIEKFLALHGVKPAP